MSAGPARRLGLVTAVVALLGSLLLGGTGPSGAASHDDRAALAAVISAESDPQQAADLINRVCAQDPTKCTWNNDSGITLDYGPVKILGDMLYNCSSVKDPELEDAETAVDVAETRTETTSLEEEISLEASLSFIGLAESSVKAWAKSQQAQSFEATVSTGVATPVLPGYKGWTQAAVLSALVTGSSYVTDGIDLVQVKDIDLRYPGYEYSGPEQKAIYANRSQVMTAGEEADHCPATVSNARSGVSVAEARAASLRAARARRARFSITLCRPAGNGERRGTRCVRMPVTGRALPPVRDEVRATLTRAGRTYAVERDRRGPIRLVQTRTITPGRYVLTIRKKSENIVVRYRGKRLHRALQTYADIVPLRISWTMRT